MSVLRIKVQELTPEAFKPYGSVIELPANEDTALSADRYTYWPMLSPLTCACGKFQVGVCRMYKRPLRTQMLERQLGTQIFMTPLTGPMVIVFAKNEGLDPAERVNAQIAEAFLITPSQGIVINEGVWHYTPMPTEGDVDVICISPMNGEGSSVYKQALDKGTVVEAVV